MTKLICFFARLWRTKDGAAMAEYALIAAIICCGIALGAGKLTGSLDRGPLGASACVERPANCQDAV